MGWIGQDKGKGIRWLDTGKAKGLGEVKSLQYDPTSEEFLLYLSSHKSRVFWALLKWVHMSLV